MNIPSERRRAARQMEWAEQVLLAERLEELLDHDYIFWTSVENQPWSQLAGIMRRKRGVKPGLPDLFIHHSGRLIGIELKSWFGRVSAAQRRVRTQMLASGAQWYCCRTAVAALTALHRAGVPLSGWKPPTLEVWEEPVSDPDLTVWHPEVLAQWREDRARWRERTKARAIPADMAAELDRSEATR